jgi:heme/copper-type cytochrome/quinol oxidase subunit 2
VNNAQKMNPLALSAHDPRALYDVAQFAANLMISVIVLAVIGVIVFFVYVTIDERKHNKYRKP